MSEVNSTPAVEAVEAPAAAPEAAIAPVAAEAPEAAKVNVAEALQKDDKFAAKFAALGRQEKALRARERQVEQRLKELEGQFTAKETEVKSKYIDPEQLRKSPLKTIQDATGLTFAQLAEMALNDDKPTQEMELDSREAKIMAKLKEYEDKLEAKEKAEKQAQEAKVMSDFIATLTSFVNDTPDYEMIRANDSIDLVYQVIDEHFNKTAAESEDGTGIILSNKEAADAVENYLLEIAKKQIKLPKVSKLLQPPPAEAPATKQPQTAAKTLSNAQSTQASSPVSKFLSDEDSKKQAASLIKWND